MVDEMSNPFSLGGIITYLKQHFALRESLIKRLGFLRRLNLEMLAEGLDAALIDRGNAGLISQLCVRHHERSVSWLR